MAKYSTGGVGGDASDICELCGADGRSLKTATVAGAELEVCGECAVHGENDGGAGAGGDGDREQERRRNAARNAARMDDARSVDTDFEEGTDYEDDPLPYLAAGYGETVAAARQEVGLQLDELAAELSVAEDDLVAVEQGRAARANVGGSVIEALEERLDVDLAEE
ncbi:transcriptional regulator [Halobacteriales archaeon QS_9_70_65]|nr:MAG: transcriptional regulator [Halobacteriales archaeon QS_9_70_65]